MDAAEQPLGDVLHVEWRGRERYADTWKRQLELHTLRREGVIGDTLVLVEHEAVITLGRQGDAANLLLDEAALAARGVDLHRVERGGDITYHGPGQLVGYPIINLRERDLSIRALMRGLEEMLIRTLAPFGITAGRVNGLTGVWVGEEKIAALGVAVRNGISFHGFALNVCTDLSHFTMIVPCGIVGKRVTSIAALTESDVRIHHMRQPVVEQLAAVLGYRAVVYDADSAGSAPLR